MESLNKVLIGIQARSNNSRLPKKCFELIGGKRLLDHVIDACVSSKNYLNRYTYKRNFTVNVALLVPYNDPIKDAFTGIPIIEGPEEDVLSRFKMAQKKYNADYVCRITGDCPLIPAYIISKHITLAVIGKYDYISNVDERCRLSLDGIDCEVLHSTMLDWLDEHARSPEAREHVTQQARISMPEKFRKGFTASFFDHSDLKLSVDTEEDLKRVREHYNVVGKKLKIAEELYGRSQIQRF